MDAQTLPITSKPARDPESAPAHVPAERSFIEHAGPLALVGIFLILGCAALWLARSVVVPTFAALVVGGTIGPLVDRARRFGIPSWLTALTIVFAVLAAMVVAVTALSTPVSSWIGRAPEFRVALEEKLSVLHRPMTALQEFSATLNRLGGGGNATVDVNQGNIFEGIFNYLTPAVGELVLFFGTLLFFLAGRSAMKGKFALAFEKREHRLAALHTMREIEADLGAYLVTATAINVGLGICATIVLYLIGVPNAYLWGLMATVLNFIPYIGPAIMLVVLFVVGLVTFPSLGYAVLPPAAFLCLTTVEGQYLTPTIIGRRLELNPFLLFLGVAFWTWLWGPFGAFLSVPILIICMVVARLYFPEEAPMQLP